MEEPIELGVIQNCVECVLGIEQNAVVAGNRTALNNTARVLFTDIAFKCGHTRPVLQNFFRNKNRSNIYNIMKNIENYNKYDATYRRYRSKVVQLLNDAITSKLSRKVNDVLIARVLDIKA